MPASYKRHGVGVLQPTPTAVLFPGQGSQQPGMRELVAAVRPDLIAQVTPPFGPTTLLTTGAGAVSPLGVGARVEEAA